MDADVTRQRIAAVIEQEMDRAEGVPMRWGRNDCVLWAARILKRGAGISTVEHLAQTYHSRKSAYRIIGPGGIAGRLRTLAVDKGWRPTHPAFAAVGDVGVIKSQLGQTTVINYRPGFWIARADCGFVLVPDNRVKLCWNIFP